MAFDPNEYQWPDGTPRNCPPSEAEPANGVFYRAVKSIPVDESDFLRWIDEPHNICKPIKCNGCGVSLFISEESARRLFERFPNRWHKEPNHGVVSAELAPDMGVIMQTGQDREHFDLWKQNGVELSQHFG